MQDIPYDTSHVPIDYDDSVNVKKVRNKVSRTVERRERREQRAALERDVSQLQRQLVNEMNVRNALYRGISRPLGSLPRIYADLPVETRNLLLEVAVLEEEIVSLEKQVTDLGREIEIEGVPALDKETIWESTVESPSPKKVEIVVSPLISPRNSARINSKVTTSSRKSIDQKNNPSKPSFSAGKVLENKRSFIKVSVPAPRSSVDNGSSIKPLKSPRDSSEPTDVFSLVPPQKPQLQRNSSFPKGTPSTIRELKSRRLSVSQKEPQEPSGAMHTVPFIPIKLSPPKGDEESTPPESPALVIPGESYSQPSTIKTGNRGNTPMISNSRSGRKDLINSKVTPKTRTVKARGASRPAGPSKGSSPTSRILRPPPTNNSILTSRTMSTATSKQRTTTKEDASASNTSTPHIKCDLCLPKPVDAEPYHKAKNNMDIPSIVSETADDCKPNQRSPDEPPLAAGSGSSSQASISTKLSSASPGGTRGGAHINFWPDDRYVGSFMMMRSASTKYMRDCYSGEVAEALRDPIIYLNKENMSSGTGFHQGLMI